MMDIGEFTQKLWDACEEKGWNPANIAIAVRMDDRWETVEFSPDELKMNPGKEQRVAEAKLQITEYLLTRERPTHAP